MRWSAWWLAVVVPMSAWAGGEPCGAAKDPKHACDAKATADACLKAGDALVAIAGCREAALERYQAACDRKALRGCSKLAFRLVQTSRD